MTQNHKLPLKNSLLILDIRLLVLDMVSADDLRMWVHVGLTERGSEQV